MTLVTLDCIGLPCPQPVLRTKESLDQGATQVSVVVDNEASKNNVARFARNQGHQVEVSAQDNGSYTISITAATGQQSQPFDPEAYQCNIPVNPKLVYVIASDSMGRGSDELGWALLQTYIQTIKTFHRAPRKSFCIMVASN